MKVLLHAHTSWSHDGRYTPARVGDEAARRGFDVVLVSDHQESLDAARFASLVKACRAVAHPMMIPGVERDWDGFHVCAFGIEDWIDDPTLATWAAHVRAAGGLVSCAHPVRYGHRVPAAILAVSDLVEVWNAQRRYNGAVAPDPRAWRLVRDGRVAIAAQDAHRGRDFNAVGVEIRDVATPAEVLAEIRAGRIDLVGRFVRVHERPHGARAAAYLMIQWLRPVVWAIPVALYRFRQRRRSRPTS